MGIIDEIAKARKCAMLEGREPNIVIVPESRRPEVTYYTTRWVLPIIPQKGNTIIFGCEIIYSAEADKIKAGFVL